MFLALYDVLLLNYKRPFTLLAGGEYVNVKLSEYLEQNRIQGVVEDDGQMFADFR